MLDGSAIRISSAVRTPSASREVPDDDEESDEESEGDEIDVHPQLAPRSSRAEQPAPQSHVVQIAEDGMRSETDPSKLDY